jgi:hemolysin III
VTAAMVRGEIFNSVSHLAGSVFAVAGLAVLLVTAIHSGDGWKITSFAVYGVTLVALYLFSTLYHGLSGRSKRIFRKLDHTSIYVLIAGTYTPFALVSLRGLTGYVLLGIVWALAAAGILQEFLLTRRIRALSVSLYLLMGWLALAVFLPLLRAIGPAGMTLLVAGGLLYTIGVFFYLVDEKYAHSHGVFHLFVLGGSILHFLVVLLFVAGASRNPRSHDDYRRFVIDAEKPLEAALADFDSAAARGDSVARLEAARRAFDAARSARDLLEAHAVSEELVPARWEELLFLNHVVPAFQAYLASGGGPPALENLRSILARGRSHQRRGREALFEAPRRPSGE